MRVLLLVATLVGLALPEMVAAQSQGRGKRIDVKRASPVWDVARGRQGDVAWGQRDRDDDSDSDSEDRRRGARDRGTYDPGSIWDRDHGRRGRAGTRAQRCDRVEAQLERQHDQWHYANDRRYGTRGYEQAHDNLHDRIERRLEREGCDEGLSRGSVLEDVILGRRGGTDRRDDGTIRGRLPIPGAPSPDTRDRTSDGRLPTERGRFPIPTRPDTRQRVTVDQMGRVLELILGGGS